MLDLLNELTKKFPDADSVALRSAFEAEVDFEESRTKKDRTRGRYQRSCETAADRLREWIEKPEDSLYETIGISGDAVTGFQLDSMARLVRFVGSRRSSCTWAILFGVSRRLPSTANTREMYEKNAGRAGLQR